MVLGAAMLQRPVSSSTRRRPCNPFGTGHGKRVRPSSGQQPLSNTAGQLPAPDCPGKGGGVSLSFEPANESARGASRDGGAISNVRAAPLRRLRARWPRGGEWSGVEWSGAAATGPRPLHRPRGVLSGGLPPRPGCRGAVAVEGGAVGSRRAAPRPVSGSAHAGQLLLPWGCPLGSGGLC